MSFLLLTHFSLLVVCCTRGIILPNISDATWDALQGRLPIEFSSWFSDFYAGDRSQFPPRRSSTSTRPIRELCLVLSKVSRMAGVGSRRRWTTSTLCAHALADPLGSSLVGHVGWDDSFDACFFPLFILVLCWGMSLYLFIAISEVLNFQRLCTVTAPHRGLHLEMLTLMVNGRKVGSLIS